MVPNLQVGTSSAAIRVANLEVNSESIISKSSIATAQVSPGYHITPTTMKKVSHLERIAAQLQANKLPKVSEVKTEAITTSGLTTTNSLLQRGSDASQPKSVATYNKMVDVTTVSPVATNAAQESILGKRIRRQSSKYEDYEQHSITVRKIIISFDLPLGRQSTNFVV